MSDESLNGERHPRHRKRASRVPPPGRRAERSEGAARAERSPPPRRLDRRRVVAWLCVARPRCRPTESGMSRDREGRCPSRRLLFYHRWLAAVNTKKIAGQAGRSTSRPLKPEQRLLILDTWRRSGLPAGDFAALVGLSKHTLYAWKKKFEEEGPGGLMDRPKGGPRGSRLSDLTKRTILMLKQANPGWGCQRISDMLLRGPALPASPSAVAKVLHEAGYRDGGSRHARRIPSATRASSGPHRIRSGKRICLRLSSSGKIGGSTWSPSWTTTAASSSATGCTPASRRHW